MKRMFIFLLFLCLIPLYSQDNIWKNVAGKVFDVNPEHQRARFLKQDITVDVEPGEKTAWYSLSWTNDTVLTQKTRRPTFDGMTGPVMAEFRGINKHNLTALKAGKAFRARQVFIYPDRTDVTGISEDGNSVVGRFTPAPAKSATNGVLKVGKLDIPVSLQQGGSRIVVMQTISAADMAKGAWKATVTGEKSTTNVKASSILMEPLIDPLTVDNPNLPRVLSVGDSISINYMNSAKEALKGIANYHRIEDNCWSTRRGMAFMQYWLGDYTKKGLGWDIILFNSGMHDMKKKSLDGPYAVSLEEYKSNLRTEIEVMKKTGATLIFVTTTPVPNDGGSDRYAYRSKGAEKDFNKAALELLKEFPDIQVLDLAQVVHDSPVMDKWRRGSDVHYWKEEEQVVLGKAIAEAVKQALAAPAEK